MRRGCSKLSRLAAWLMIVGGIASFLIGCGDRSGPPQPPVNIASGDTCAVCGMYIRGYPGPRGEAYLRGDKKPLKFGSTRDFFAYVTRADVKSHLGALYVQDVAQIDWSHPSNASNSFINARKAWYVAWQSLRGAMGPTLASFANRADARAFMKVHGGMLLRFNQVTPALISDLGSHCPGKKSALNAIAKSCLTPHHLSNEASSHEGETQKESLSESGVGKV